jgi:hypothetical protein
MRNFIREILSFIMGVLTAVIVAYFLIGYTSDFAAGSWSMCSACIMNSIMKLVFNIYDDN